MEIDPLITVVQEMGRLTGVSTPTIDRCWRWCSSARGWRGCINSDRYDQPGLTVAWCLALCRARREARRNGIRNSQTQFVIVAARPIGACVKRCGILMLGLGA